MFRKGKLIAAILLILTLVQSTSSYFVTEALADSNVSAPGYAGDLMPVGSTKIFSSANISKGPDSNGNVQNPPSTKTTKQDDTITYNFKVTRDLINGDYIVLGFDQDTQSTGHDQYNLLPANVPQTVVSANPSWLAGPNDRGNSDVYIQINNPNYKGGVCPDVWGGNGSRCIFIGPKSPHTIPANTPITITIKVENPGGNEDTIDRGAGWYPVGIRITQGSKGDGDYFTSGSFNDRIQVGNPSYPRPTDTRDSGVSGSNADENDCGWTNISACVRWVLGFIAGIIFNALANI